MRHNKKIDYIFLLTKDGEDDMGEILDLALKNGAKFLYLSPREQIDSATSLIFEYEKNKNLNARIVKAPLVLFKKTINNNGGEPYINDCVEKIQEAMFGAQTRGGLILLPEPPFVDVGGGLENKQKITKGSLSKRKIKNIFLLLLLSFIIPVILITISSIVGFYQLVLFQQSFLKGESTRAQFFLKVATPSFAIAQKAYDLLNMELALVKKEDSLQNLGYLLGTGSEVNRGGYHLVRGAVLLESTFENLLGNKNPNQENSLTLAKTELLLAQEKLVRAELLAKNIDNLPFFDGELKKGTVEINKYRRLLDKTISLLDVAPTILGGSGKKTYLVLLQNNMELRPTGGFIGSYGLLSFENSKFLGFEIFDVYSADGQLKGHIEPPAPIKKYLNQPHWFLRDSNWDPDFTVSAQKASWFLEKETGQKVDGVIAMDVSGVGLIIGAIGDVSLPDYQEAITKDNLFERAHFYAQKDFFSGSTQKRDFLSSLARMIFDKLINDKSISWPLVLNSLILGIEEKHLIFAFNLNNLTVPVFSQKEKKEGMLNDFLMIVDANLGVNKVNYFIKRNIANLVFIDEGGGIVEILKITYINQSPNESYKNYLRIITPNGTNIKKVEFDDMEIREIDREDSGDKSTFGFLVEIPARSQKIVTVTYGLSKLMPIRKGLNFYNLQVLKQPGTLADSLAITVSYPEFLTVQKINKEEGKIFSSSKTVNIISDLSQDREFEIEFLNK